jgi:hypothetical protein
MINAFGRWWSVMVATSLLMELAWGQGVWNSDTGHYQLSTPTYQVDIDGNGFRFGFSGFGAAPVEAHSSHGLALGGSPIQSILSVTNVGGHDQFRVQAANGKYNSQ